jgi:hypothetical protein
MAITINGSGTVTGISAGGLPDGVITTDELASTVPVAKAWVNFNGTGTVAIRASYNVSSITDNNTGDYTVNFTTALADANYSITASAGGGNLTGTNPLIHVVTANVATGSVNVIAAVGTGLPSDRDLLAISIFR